MFSMKFEQLLVMSVFIVHVGATRNIECNQVDLVIDRINVNNIWLSPSFQKNFDTLPFKEIV